jgi:hypothetical protein
MPTRAFLVPDLNGDGGDEIVFGVPTAEHNGRELSGTSYVVFGRGDTTPVDVGAPGSGTLTIDGAQPGDRAGSPGGAGDFNGDGRSDLAVGSSGASTDGRLDSGSVALFYGPLSAGTVDLLAPGAADVTIRGATGSTVGNVGDQAGGTVFGVRDLGGDGFDDLAVSARAVFVVPGRPQPGVIDLATLDGGLRVDGGGVLQPAPFFTRGRPQLVLLADQYSGIFDVDPTAPEPGRSGAVTILTSRAKISGSDFYTRRRAVAVELECPAAQTVSCVGVLKFRRAGRRIAKSAFGIRPATSQQVGVTLNHAAERAVRRAGRVRAEAVVKRPGLTSLRTKRRIEITKAKRKGNAR